MAPDQASAALLSCLGFPGWGGLHLIVPSRGDPPAMALRLRLSAADPGNGRADSSPSPATAGLLSALLRQHRDLEPLHPALWPWARETAMGWPQAWGHRYLLVCRWGSIQPLRISAWRLREGGPPDAGLPDAGRRGQAGSWTRLCGPLEPEAFQHRFLANTEAARRPARLASVQEITKATPSPTTIRAMAPTAQ